MTAIKTLLDASHLHWTGAPHSATAPVPEVFSFRCVGCGAELDWPAARRRRRAHLRCSACRRRLHLPRAQRAGCPSCRELASRALPPRHLSMQCGHCGLLFKASPPLASAATRRVRRKANRRRIDAVAFLVASSGILAFGLLCLLMWIL